MKPTYQSRTEVISIPGLKRLNYFEAQPLLADSLREEQMYFVNKLRQHNRAVFNTGVIKGLTLKCSGQIVTINSGFAMDTTGQLIELSTPYKIHLPNEDGAWDIMIELVEEKCNSSWWLSWIAKYHTDQFSSIQEVIRIWFCEPSENRDEKPSDTSIFLGRIKAVNGLYKLDNT